MTDLSFFECNLHSFPGTAPDISIISYFVTGTRSTPKLLPTNAILGGAGALQRLRAAHGALAIASSFDFSAYSYVVQLAHLHLPILQWALLDVVNCQTGRVVHRAAGSRWL